LDFVVPENTGDKITNYNIHSPLQYLWIFTNVSHLYHS